ncbi:MAG: pyruvate:ferredoxin (flavodoxin) oxidoreductase [Opitutaceae bacterium]|jgi:pyruvate-ferredoxin/flavodoxin oxidoreductase|nr:pyruvate:ferredoxin (flavodoxin) oxidoreductase [Opitutaceae bacterium]
MKNTTAAHGATIDANEAVASVAYRMTEVFAIYPITPSTPMAEIIDEWAVAKKNNLFGHVPEIIEMQSEAGAAGAVHGALQGGALSSTFTASQGLLLMIPNMYKIAGELTPCVFHVTARTLATHALSIFGDHSDVMACRQTGWIMLASNSPQQAQDLAAIAHATTLRARIPVLHFFDGFRTSHEINTVKRLDDATLAALPDPAALAAHRARGLTPDRPAVRGTAQNPDVFFQAREACNPYYNAVPAIMREEMDKFARLTGRAYDLVAYEGAPDAEHVVVIMGSGAETTVETAKWLNAQGRKTGVLAVHLYRPFPVEAFIKALPKTVRRIAVLDRTKEPGALGDPLYLDVAAAVRMAEDAGHFATADGAAARVKIIGGRYGLSSKEYTPAHAAAVFEELRQASPRHSFTVGINDDITGLSLPVDETIDIEDTTGALTRAVFFGLGADGTVGANKNTIKIIGTEAGKYAQGYFVYDSKKSGGFTVSHLRFGDHPIRAPYLIRNADFVACHQFHLLDTQPVLGYAAPGANLLLNAPGDPETLWERLSAETQAEILAKKLRVYAIDAGAVARAAGLGGRINTIMQVCFFKLSNVMPLDQAITSIKGAIKKSYSNKGEAVVAKNIAGVDSALSALKEVRIPAAATPASTLHRQPPVPTGAPDFVRNVTGVILAGLGDRLPVSAFTPDGTWPTATARYEKRNLAARIPVWDPAICIQCNKCVQVCPHAAIRAKFYDPALLAGAPAVFKSVPFRSTEFKGNNYTLQVAAEDCTGCELCVATCPAKNKADPNRRAINMEPQLPLRDQERANFDFFLSLPQADRARLKGDTPKNVQFFEPLFEFSGACAGCGETPYIKLLTQLFGDRAVIANATGCSSIYGGNLPTTPYTVNAEGRGPAWANSLFEDNAEFGLGLRLSLDNAAARARRLLGRLAGKVGAGLAAAILDADQTTDAAIVAQRARIATLREKLAALAAGDSAAAAGTATVPAPDAAADAADAAAARELATVADHLVNKTVWILGGDGWAYDIGYGGLDHVIASGRDVNILVLDTEVYSNTGGQCSKSTPLGAAAKFAAAGKPSGKKDLGMLAMAYGNVYVARVALGARDTQTLNALREAESYPGPSLIIAYSHCIAHGFNLTQGMEHQKLAVDTGYWPLYRFDPRRADKGENPLVLDSAAPKTELSKLTRLENRYAQIARRDPALVARYETAAQAGVNERYRTYKKLAEKWPAPEAAPAAATAPAAPAAPGPAAPAPAASVPSPSPSSSPKA